MVGTVKAIQWQPSTGDTGAGLTLALNPRNTDTGHAVVFYTAGAADMGSDFKVTDTGSLARVFGAGDNVRVIFSNSTTLAGTLYLWHDENN